MDALPSEQTEAASTALPADGEFASSRKNGPLIELPAETQYRRPGER